MIGELIYEEGSSYFGGKNAYGEEWKTVIKYGDKYYSIEFSGSYNGTRRSISEIEFDPQNMPDEYNRVELDERLKGAGTRYSLVHGTNEKIDVDLTRYVDVPESLEEIKAMEIEADMRAQIEKCKEDIQKAIEKDELYSEEYILNNSELNEEEKKVALGIRNSLIDTVIENKSSIGHYREVFENMTSIVKDDAIVTTHEFSRYYVSPSDYVINKRNPGYWGESFLGYGVSKVCDIHFISKRTPLAAGKTYLGSYMGEGYPVDIVETKSKDGDTTISAWSNISRDWYNNQKPWMVDIEDIGIDRYDIDSGEVTPELEKINGELRAIREYKKEYFQDVMHATMDEFGLTWKGAKHLLKYAGTVSILSHAVSLHEKGLKIDDALAIMRKTSHKGVERALKDANIPVDGYYMHETKVAAELIAYVESLEEQIEKATDSSLGKKEKKLMEIEEKYSETKNLADEYKKLAGKYLDNEKKK